MLRDNRNKQIEEGDLLAFNPAILSGQNLLDGIALSISAPMVNRTPQGELVTQQCRVAIIVNMNTMTNGQLPVLILDKRELEPAVKARQDLSDLVERLMKANRRGQGRRGRQYHRHRVKDSHNQKGRGLSCVKRVLPVKTWR